jgi:hypothetical protein
MTATSKLRFTAADVERVGRRADDDGDLYAVRSPNNTGTIFVSDRALAAFGSRIDAGFVARRLNKFVARVGATEALGCLAGGGRHKDAVELAPDGTIDEF